MAPWLRLFRITLLPTALSNMVVGMAVVSAACAASSQDSPELSWRQLPLLKTALMAACLYMFGMGLNDWRDRNRDAELYPDRPIPSGAISPASALVVLVLLAAGALALAASIATPVLVTAATLFAAILLYNLVCKQLPILSPLTMGSVRGILVCLGGAVVSGRAFHPHCFFAALVVAAYVAALTHYSMAEEHGRRPQLRRRFLFLAVAPTLAPLWLLMADVPGAQVKENLSLVAVWALPLAWLAFYAAAPLRTEPPRPGLVTFRALLGLFTLDVALLLSYASFRPALVSVLLSSFVLLPVLVHLPRKTAADPAKST